MIDAKELADESDVAARLTNRVLLNLVADGHLDADDVELWRPGGMSPESKRMWRKLR